MLPCWHLFAVAESDIFFTTNAFQTDSREDIDNHGPRVCWNALKQGLRQRVVLQSMCLPCWHNCIGSHRIGHWPALSEEKTKTVNNRRFRCLEVEVIWSSQRKEALYIWSCFSISSDLRQSILAGKSKQFLQWRIILVQWISWSPLSWSKQRKRLCLWRKRVNNKELLLKMALEEWKEVVGNTATICTIVQFLVGAQVFKSTKTSLTLAKLQVCLGYYRAKSTGESSIMTFLVSLYWD